MDQKLLPVPKYTKSIAELQAEALQQTKKTQPDVTDTEAEEHEDLVDLDTTFAEPGAFLDVWSTLSDDAAIMETEEGKLEDIENSRQLLSQGLAVLQASKLAEMEACEQNANALIAQAAAQKARQRALHLGTCGIQRMRLALAFTPASKFVDTLQSCLPSAEDLGLRQSFTPNPSPAVAAKEVAEVLVQQSMVLPPGSRATAKGPYSLAVPPPSQKGVKYHADRLFTLDAKGNQIFYFACPWPLCETTTGGRDAMAAHIRTHTKQILLCPNNKNCADVARTGHPMASRNADSIRNHYRHEAKSKGIVAGDINQPVPVIQIQAPSWFKDKK